jgi:hypothetical protein
VSYHVRVVLVDSCPIRSEVLGSPFPLGSIRAGDSDKNSSRDILMEIKGMSLAHSSETSDSNLELARCHCIKTGEVGEAVKKLKEVNEG